MAIDLKNPESFAGAEAALKILLKAKNGPIHVSGGGSNGQGGLLPPPNMVMDDPQGPQQPEEPQGPQDGPNGAQRVEDGQNSEGQTTGGEGQPEDKKDNQPDNKKDGQPGNGTSKDGQEGEESEDEKNAKTLQGIKDDIQAKKEQEQQAKQDAFDQLMKQQKAANGGDYSDFVMDLKLCMAQQAREAERYEDNYQRGPNASYAGTDYLLPKDNRVEKKDVPNIYVFFDVSGSCRPAMDLGIAALKELDRLVKNKKIEKPELYYFADKLSNTTSVGLGGSTDGFPLVMNFIKESLSKTGKNQVKNVIVISDDDIGSQSGWGQKFVKRGEYGHGWDEPLEIKGHVFWCWVHGNKSQKPMKYLTGRKGSTQYNI